ncbi:coiled-coil domain-containing protein [Streptomyces carminius]|uniref:cellulose-binding protein n=1 Tax=Streptomyces carminius TaxID=2665496 RepID=UPI001304330C|nr:cellulose-binding protein [Streptomyces carminius]
MSASRSPHGFVVVRRGYRPDQVDRHASGLHADLEEARERLARLGGRVGELEEEAARLRSEAESLPVQTYEALGERARLILAEVEAEAGELRSRADTEAREVLVRAEEESRALRESAREASARVRAGGDATAEALLGEARRQAEDLLRTARTEATELRVAAERVLREAVERCEALRLAQERKQAEETAELDRALAAREAEVTARVTGLVEHGDELLSRARRERGAAEDTARLLTEEARERADELLAQARLRRERIERETERVVRTHDQRREAVRQHMAHVRASLATLTGRGLEGLDGSGADAGSGPEEPGGPAVPGQGAPAE